MVLDHGKIIFSCGHICMGLWPDMANTCTKPHRIMHGLLYTYCNLNLGYLHIPWFLSIWLNGPFYWKSFSPYYWCVEEKMYWGGEIMKKQMTPRNSTIHSHTYTLTCLWTSELHTCTYMYVKVPSFLQYGKQ